MKKTVVAIFLSVICLLLCACGETKTAQENTVTLGKVTVTLDGELTDGMLEELGTPVDTVEAPSCHYDGTDTIYYYGSYNVYTYMKGEQKIVYSVELLDNTCKTLKGGAVGMSKDEIVKLYGNDFTEKPYGIEYDLSDTLKVSFKTENDTVSSVEYLSE